MSKFNNFRNYNPDILETIANLSNDEVFTPPKLANEILDLLPEEVWSDSTITFLDPAVKTGIFLREIASRLIDGLAEEIPDLQERVNHILTKQVFGIGITELTTLMARRTVYCSMYANGPYSICTKFDDEKGNIIFPDTEHTWDKNGRCEYCGANRENYGGGANRESYAYPFIHDNFEKEFGNMKFDVIIGNPPYQLSDGTGGGGSSSVPLYNKFIDKAKQLNPTYLSMIIPARWYTGGKGLTQFRKEMLSDKRILELHDFVDETECFNNLQIEGGVCYFLWKHNYNGKCKVLNHKNGTVSSKNRYLDSISDDYFIRDNNSISILNKVSKHNEKTINELVSTSGPFGFRTNFKGQSNIKNMTNPISIYVSNRNVEYVEMNDITKNIHYVDKYKVFLPKAYGSSGRNVAQKVINNPFLGLPNQICTETYLMINGVNSKKEAINLKRYIETKFFRYMVYLMKSSQNMSASTYSLVPLQDFSKPWTDEELYKKYKLTQEEIDYIEENIAPMPTSDD